MMKIASISILLFIFNTNVIGQPLSTNPYQLSPQASTATIPASSLPVASSLPLQPAIPSSYPIGSSLQFGNTQSYTRPSSPLATLSDDSGLTSLLHTATDAIQSASRNSPPPTSPPQTIPNQMASSSIMSLTNAPMMASTLNQPIMTSQPAAPGGFYTQQAGQITPMQSDQNQIQNTQPSTPVRYTRPIGMNVPTQMSGSPTRSLPLNNVPAMNSDTSDSDVSTNPNSTAVSMTLMPSDLMNTAPSLPVDHVPSDPSMSDASMNINPNPSTSQSPSSVASEYNPTPSASNAVNVNPSSSSPVRNDELVVQYEGMDRPIGLGLSRIPHFESSDPSLRAAFAQSRGYSLALTDPQSEGIRSSPYATPEIPPPQPSTPQTETALNQQRQQIQQQMENVQRLPTQQLAGVRTNLNNQ